MAGEIGVPRQKDRCDRERRDRSDAGSSTDGRGRACDDVAAFADLYRGSPFARRACQFLAQIAARARSLRRRTMEERAAGNVFLRARATKTGLRETGNLESFAERTGPCV